MNRITAQLMAWTTKPRILTMVGNQYVAIPAKTTVTASVLDRTMKVDR